MKDNELRDDSPDWSDLKKEVKEVGEDQKK